MKHFLLLIVSVIMLAASACSEVTVTEPIGEEPVRVQAKEWQGLWKLYPYDDEEDFLLIEVSNIENGVLDVQKVAREPEPFQVYLRESNGLTFASFKFPEGADDKGMFWGKLEKDRDRIIFWVPDYDRFSELVSNGLLPGHLYTGESKGGKPLILSDTQG